MDRFPDVWDLLFGEDDRFNDEHPGRYEPAADSRPATVYLPTRDYALLQGRLVENHVSFVSMSDDEDDARIRQGHFLVECEEQDIDPVNIGGKVYVNVDDYGDIRGYFMVCRMVGPSCEHVPVVFYDRPDGEYTDQRALGESYVIAAEVGGVPPLIVKPYRSVLRWWLVYPNRTPDNFARVLAGSAYEAIVAAEPILGTILCHAEELAPNC